MHHTAKQLADLESIRAAVLRYCRGVDRLDPALMKSAYWPEARDDHGVFVGNAMEFVDHCMESHRRWQATSHCVFNHSIELDADDAHARGEVYNVTYLFHKDGGGVDTWHGRYLDCYEKRGDEWRILERVCVHEGTYHQSAPPMAIDSASFRQGSADRDNGNARLGP